jgi:hypothetical protein
MSDRVCLNFKDITISTHANTEHLELLIEKIKSSINITMHNAKNLMQMTYYISYILLLKKRFLK